MQLRPNNRSANQRQRTQHNDRLNGSVQKQIIPNSFALNTASNNELKQIIQNLISKSRSLITSLQTTLKQLEEVKLQKDFWKGHYFAFRNACQKCINSKGIAPFQYIAELEKTVKEWTWMKEDEKCTAGSGNKALNLKVMSLANSRMKVNFSSQEDKPNHFKDPYQELFSNDKTLQSEKHCINQSAWLQKMNNTEARTPAKPYPLPTDQKPTISQNTASFMNNTLDSSFTGMRLGHTGSKQKNSPNNPINPINSYEKTFKRKDSIETKRIGIFSFAQHKNQSKNLNRTLELNI